MRKHGLGIALLTFFSSFCRFFYFRFSSFVRFRLYNAIEVILGEFLKLYCRYPYVDNPEGLPERTNEAAGEYARACIAVANGCRVPVIDLWTKMQQSPDWKKNYLRFPKFYFLCLSLHKAFWNLNVNSIQYLPFKFKMIMNMMALSCSLSEFLLICHNGII